MNIEQKKRPVKGTKRKSRDLLKTLDAMDSAIAKIERMWSRDIFKASGLSSVTRFRFFHSSTMPVLRQPRLIFFSQIPALEIFQAPQYRVVDTYADV